MSQTEAGLPYTLASADMTETTQPSGEGLAFLQRRVGSFGLVSGALVLAFYVYRLACERALPISPRPAC